MAQSSMHQHLAGIDKSVSVLLSGCKKEPEPLE
jgi:hypothetical protein